MADFPVSGLPPLFFGSFSRYTGWLEHSVGANAATTALGWVANTALYIPFMLPWPYPVRRVFWSNASSITTTNRDFGIYTADGTRLYSTGSTAASGVNLLQYVTPTQFLLAPGRYYMAIVTDTSTGARGGTGATLAVTAREAMAGPLQEASAFPLPATMTPATITLTAFPICGFTLTSTGF